MSIIQTVIATSSIGGSANISPSGNGLSTGQYAFKIDTDGTITQGKTWGGVTGALLTGDMTFTWYGNFDDQSYQLDPVADGGRAVTFLGNPYTSLYVSGNGGFSFGAPNNRRDGNPSNASTDNSVPCLYMNNNDGNLTQVSHTVLDTTLVYKIKGNTDYTKRHVNYEYDIYFYTDGTVDVFVNQEPRHWQSYIYGQGSVKWGVTNGTTWVDGLSDHSISIGGCLYARPGSGNLAAEWYEGAVDVQGTPYDPLGYLDSVSNGVSGLVRRTYDELWANEDSYHNDNPSVFNNTITDQRSDTNICFLDQETKEFYCMEWKGYFQPDSTGDWNFAISADDVVMVWIGEAALDPTSENWVCGDNTSYNVNPNSVSLIADKWYPIRIRYQEWGGGETCEVFAAPANTTFYALRHYTGRLQYDSTTTGYNV